MAKIKGPLHSVSASGSIGGTLTLLRQFKTDIAKKKSKPGGTASAAQIQRRAFYRQAANDWSALSPQDKAAYTPSAQARNISPFNAYMSAQLATYSGGTGKAWDNGAAVWDGGTAVWS